MTCTGQWGRSGTGRGAIVGPACAPSTSSRRGSPDGRARRAGVATECRTGGHNTDDVGFVQASSRRTTLFLLPGLSVLSGILGPDVEWRGAAMAAEDTGALRTAYFGAGDAKQLAPYFRSLSYRGVRSAAVGLAEGVEVVRVVYDSARVPFSDLLRIYFRRVDARDAGGQFKERGARFAPAVWCGDGPSRDFEEAERVLALLGRSGVFGNDPTEPLAVRIVPGKSREALEAAPFFVVAVV